MKLRRDPDAILTQKFVNKVVVRHEQSPLWAGVSVRERRVVYVTEVAGRLWVIHAFRKKSKTGIGTPRADIDLVRSRLARLRRETMP